jgi:hypothetical protein
MPRNGGGGLMKAEEKNKIKENLKYNRFRGKEAAREYMKGVYERRNDTTTFKDLINQVLRRSNDA